MAKRRHTELLVVHVTATPRSLDIGARELDAMHKARGWSGIGYHRVIRRDGRVEQGRPMDQIGAHLEGWNSVSVGVSLVGGIDTKGRPENNATAAQMTALEGELRRLLQIYPGAKICGHRDLSPDRDGDGVIEPAEHIKACPCFDVIPWANARGLPVAKIRGVWDAHGPVAAAGPAAKAGSAKEGPDARIVWLQRLLARAGFAFGAIDGYLGPRTEAAIRQYQLFAGLPQTGAFDAATVATLLARFEKAAA